MYKKYEFTGEEKVIDNHTLHRIRAMRNFGVVRAGDLGGWIESEDNLSHDGNAWVYGDALVYGNARVCGNAWVYSNAWVYGDARVYSNALVYGNARVCGNAWVYGDALVYGDARVYSNAWVYGDALVCGSARVCGNAEVCGSARVCGNADYAVVHGFGSEQRCTTFFRCKDGLVRARCGYFYGDLREFCAKVKETHGESKMAKEYLMIADLMEMHFAKEG